MFTSNNTPIRAHPSSKRCNFLPKTVKTTITKSVPSGDSTVFDAINRLHNGLKFHVPLSVDKSRLWEKYNSPEAAIDAESFLLNHASMNALYVELSNCKRPKVKCTCSRRQNTQKMKAGTKDTIEYVILGSYKCHKHGKKDKKGEMKEKLDYRWLAKESSSWNKDPAEDLEDVDFENEAPTRIPFTLNSFIVRKL